MQFSIRVICHNRHTDIAYELMKDISRELGIPCSSHFKSYRKNPQYSLFELGEPINDFSTELITKHIQCLAGTSHIEIKTTENEWEFAHYTDPNELDNQAYTAFVVCNLFQL